MKRSILWIVAFALVFVALSALNVPALAQTQTPTPVPTFSATTPLGATVVASQLYVRAQARIGSNVLTAVNWGDKLVVLGRNSRANWLEVIAPDGTVGWVSAFWVRLSLNIPRSSLPILV